MTNNGILTDPKDIGKFLNDNNLGVNEVNKYANDSVNITSLLEPLETLKLSD